MKFAALMSAGLIAAAAFAPATAGAQEVHHDRVVTRAVHAERHGGLRNHTRRQCSMNWHHHRQVRVCRTVRY